MKQCPKCRQLFAGGDLRFCRFDGSRLINETITPPEEAVTILFPTGPLNNQSVDGLHHRNQTGKLSK
ncbi:MAG TPA: hypothetical protein VFY67_15545 [Pyrinomonadaceae bacterium]|nr:hypothetical protein [Pyrinomonadaceae bacterium]